MMPRRRHLRRAAVIAATAVFALWLPVAASRGEGLQTDNPYLVKAAYLVNFAKYVSWPSGTFDDTNAPVRIGILGRDPFGVEFDRILGNRPPHLRRIEIHRADDLASLLNCHILYLGASEKDRVGNVLAALGTRPVVTVGEDRDFLDQGGMIRFLIHRQAVLFDVHLDHTARAGIEVNVRMLETANRVVREAAMAPGDR